jgi:membrane protein YdbS with pleckstrin-like domain
MNQIESSIWQQASKLLVEKRLQESKIKFQELINMKGDYVAKGYFGLGLVEERWNNIDEAIRAFEQALAIDPTMEGPAQQLAQLAPRGIYGTFEFLRRNPTPQAQQALVLMNQLRTVNEVRPSLTAYLGQFMPSLCALSILLISSILFWILYIHHRQLLLFVGIIPLAIVVFVNFRLIIKGIWRFLEWHNTRYTIIHGRIYVKVGVFQKKTVPYELFRVRYINLEQSFLQRLTKDGTLVIDLEIERGEPKVVRITGLARGEELEAIHRKLINLVGLLRSIPELKGFIQ